MKDINVEGYTGLFRAGADGPARTAVALLASPHHDGGAALFAGQAACEHLWALVETRREGDRVIFVWECERCGDRQERS